MSAAPFRPRTLFVLTALALAARGAAAQGAPETVLITGSIVERAVAEAPYAVAVVGRDALRAAGPQINLSEALSRVPGLTVANRSNFAQDLQIGSRGFGARATFGVRGIRLLADGIPASGPDGQGQVAQFDLAGAERVEVLRGPFSVLYGNSSGGVISLVSAPVKRFEAEGELDLGGFGLQQLRAAVGAPLAGGFSLRASAAAMAYEGFRPHASAQRELANLRLGWQGAADSVVLTAGAWSQPAQDPLGLTAAQFAADPYQTTPQAMQYDTRKDSSQQQLGATWKHRFGDGALRDTQVTGWRGQRSVTQFLAIAPGTQGNAKHGGGVVDFDREFAGLDARLRFAWTGVDLQLGLAHDRQTDARRGYENFTGTGASQVLGVFGTLRRDESNRARSTDVYAQAEFALGRSASASAGLRSGRVQLSAEDHYLGNGDDSGAVSYRYTNPVLGLRWQPAPGWQLHASAARGFESPTLTEMAYRPDGTGGFNTALLPQVSRQVELGAKWRGQGMDADLAVFQIRTRDEIGIASNAGGRASYQNTGRTERRGLELGAGWQPSAAWRTRLALTLLDASYSDGFTTCTSIPCSAAAVPVAAGNRIAGAPRSGGFAELAWRSATLGEFGLEWRGSGRNAANDVNDAFGAGYGVAALRWSASVDTGNGTRLESLVRLENLTGRRYAGSLIVNESNNRYYEAGAPRNLLLALRVVGAGL